MVGSSLVWAPVAIYLFVEGSTGKGIFLVLWGMLVVSSIDNMIRPWVVGGSVELHPMVLLFFILGGVEAFGFMGLFLGPVVAAVLTAVFAMLREEVNGPVAMPVASGVPKTVHHGGTESTERLDWDGTRADYIERRYGLSPSVACRDLPACVRRYLSAP